MHVCILHAQSTSLLFHSNATALGALPIPETKMDIASSLDALSMKRSLSALTTSVELQSRAPFDASFSSLLVARPAFDDATTQKHKSNRGSENSLEARMDPTDLTAALMKAVGKLPDNQGASGGASSLLDAGFHNSINPAQPLQSTMRVQPKGPGTSGKQLPQTGPNGPSSASGAPDPIQRALATTFQRAIRDTRRPVWRVSKSKQVSKGVRAEMSMAVTVALMLLVDVLTRRCMASKRTTGLHRRPNASSRRVSHFQPLMSL